jgi:hypothetical protein
MPPVLRLSFIATCNKMNVSYTARDASFSGH